MKKNLFIFIIWNLVAIPGVMLGQTNLAPIMAGSNIGVVKTENGAVRGYIHKGIFTYKPEFDY